MPVSPLAVHGPGRTRTFSRAGRSGIVMCASRPHLPCHLVRPTMARVSIVVSHYDRTLLLAEALESIAAQTYRDFEVIVVNDHGADSRAVVETFAVRGAQGPSP